MRPHGRSLQRAYCAGVVHSIPPPDNSCQFFALNQLRSFCVSMAMTDNRAPTPFADFDLERAIALRWTLRDIKGKRLKLSPVSESDLSTLTNLGLVEMRNNVPVLTQAGHDALD